VFVFVCECVCVCVRERERERERLLHSCSNVLNMKPNVPPEVFSLTAAPAQSITSDEIW